MKKLLELHRTATVIIKRIIKLEQMNSEIRNYMDSDANLTLEEIQEENEKLDDNNKAIHYLNAEYREVKDKMFESPEKAAIMNFIPEKKESNLHPLFEEFGNILKPAFKVENQR